MKLPPFADRRRHLLQKTWSWGVVWLSLLLALPISSWAASPEAFHAVRYRLKVSYNAAERTIQGHASFAAIWRGPQTLTTVYFFLPPNTLGRHDSREPAALSDLRYAIGFDAASLTVHRVTDGTQQELSFHLQDDQAVPVGPRAEFVSTKPQAVTPAAWDIALFEDEHPFARLGKAQCRGKTASPGPYDDGVCVKHTRSTSGGSGHSTLSNDSQSDTTSLPIAAPTACCHDPALQRDLLFGGLLR